jgi:membrane-associated HD superfamily phosphohydrolase
VRFAVRPFDVLSLTMRFFIGFALLTILTTLLLASHHMRAPDEKYKEGEVVRRTIVSPADIDDISTPEIEQSKASTTSTGSTVANEAASRKRRKRAGKRRRLSLYLTSRSGEIR